MMTENITLPKSISCNLINFLGVVGFLFSILYCKHHDIRGIDATLFSVLMYGGIVIFLEVVFLHSPKRPSTGLDFSCFNWNADRIFFKLTGLYACYAFVALIYWGAPVYCDRFFDPYYEAIYKLFPYLMIASVPYVALVDCYMKQPEDNYYWMGRFLLLRGRGTTWRAFTQLITGWIVKGYFLPLMFIFFIGDVNYLINFDTTENQMTFLNVYHPMVAVVFVLDLLAAVGGYMLTFRLFDTHLRSVEPTFFGWFICLSCYDPFNGTYLNNYFRYRGNDDRWIDWLQDKPEMLIIWGGLIFFFIFIYTVAGMNFGIRFSNITHRGVLTNGMYRFTKHPEYLSKNTFWWLTFCPFITLPGEDHSYIESLRFFILMLGVNGTYFWRARTEERHMSRDPVYVEYALWMNEHGVLAWLGRLIPYFQYKAPENWRSLPPVYMGIK